jgi:branched-chain amino acid transport system permease protein
VLVWAIWALSGGLIAEVFPPDQQARAASLQIVIIGVMLSAILLWRPQGLLPEVRTVSRHLRAREPG